MTNAANTLPTGTTGTVEMTVHTREGATIITRNVEVIDYADEMAPGLVRVKFTDETASMYGSHGFRRVDEITVNA